MAGHCPERRTALRGRLPYQPASTYSMPAMRCINANVISMDAFAHTKEGYQRAVLARLACQNTIDLPQLALGIAAGRCMHNVCRHSRAEHNCTYTSMYAPVARRPSWHVAQGGWGGGATDHVHCTALWLCQKIFILECMHDDGNALHAKSTQRRIMQARA